MRITAVKSKVVLKWFLAVIFAQFLMSGSVLRAETGRIEGCIRDIKTGEPLPYANVILIGTGLGAASDENGRYLITRIPPGEYLLRCIFIGYKEQDVSIHISSGAVIKQDFELLYTTPNYLTYSRHIK